MIRHLVKMEFKSCYQRIGIALLGSMVIGLLLFFSGRFSFMDYSASRLLSFLWFIALTAVGILFIYNIITSFTKRIFSREGYLTLTLPVSSLQLIISKLIVQFIWLVLIFLAMLVLIGLFMLTLEVDFMDVIRGYGELLSEFFREPTAWAFLFNTVSNGLFSIGSIWFFITLMNTKLVRNRRVLLAVIANFAFSIMFGNILQFIYKSTITGYYNYSTLSMLLFGSIVNVTSWSGYYLTNGLIHLLVGGLFYFGIIYLLDNHIEVE